MRKQTNSNCRLKERSDVRPMGSNVSQSVYGDNTVGGSQGYNDMDSHACLRQAQNDSVEKGRSMVEMLGVLAIIGVLSIGGIAGYTMAMNRYKANEIMDIAAKLFTFYKIQEVHPNPTFNQLGLIDPINRTAMTAFKREMGDTRQGEYYQIHDSRIYLEYDGQISVYAPKGLFEVLKSVAGAKDDAPNYNEFVHGGTLVVLPAEDE